MKGKRYSEEQIFRILQEGDRGAKVADLCRQYGISENTYFRWKSKYSVVPQLGRCAPPSGVPSRCPRPAALQSVPDRPVCARGVTWPPPVGHGVCTRRQAPLAPPAWPGGRPPARGSASLTFCSSSAMQSSGFDAQYMPARSERAFHVSGAPEPRIRSCSTTVSSSSPKYSSLRPAITSEWIWARRILMKSGCVGPPTLSTMAAISSKRSTSSSVRPRDSAIETSWRCAASTWSCRTASRVSGAAPTCSNRATASRRRPAAKCAPASSIMDSRVSASSGPRDRRRSAYIRSRTAMPSASAPAVNSAIANSRRNLSKSGSSCPSLRSPPASAWRHRSTSVWALEPPPASDGHSRECNRPPLAWERSAELVTAHSSLYRIERRTA